MKDRFCLIFTLCLMVISTITYADTILIDNDKIIQGVIVKSHDSTNVININGKDIEFTKSVTNVYKFTSKDIKLYLFIFLVMTISMVITIRLFSVKKRKKETAIKQLSERELVVAKLIQSGKQNKQIAEELFVSISTVKTHINNIYKKLEIENRHELKKIKL